MSLIDKNPLSIQNKLININNNLIETISAIYKVQCCTTNSKTNKILNALEKDILKTVSKFQKRLRECSCMEV